MNVTLSNKKYIRNFELETIRETASSKLIKSITLINFRKILYIKWLIKTHANNVNPQFVYLFISGRFRFKDNHKEHRILLSVTGS